MKLPITLLALFSSALAFPTWFANELEPDLITAVNAESSGGHFYLRSDTRRGHQGGLLIHRVAIPDTVETSQLGAMPSKIKGRKTPKYTPPAENDDGYDLAPAFFLRDGSLYAVTNSTHMLQLAVLNVTLPIYDDNAPHPHFPQPAADYYPIGYQQAFQLKLVEEKRAKAFLGLDKVGTFVKGRFDWYGPTLVWFFGKKGEEKQSSIYWSCDHGVYLELPGHPPPKECSQVTLHSRNEFLAPRMAFMAQQGKS